MVKSRPHSCAVVWTVLNPSVQRVATTLQAHLSVMESPPLSWLKEVHPLFGWHVVPADMFQHMWIAYAKGIESLLASWKEGDFKDMRSHHRLPFSGLSSIIG